MMSHENRKFMLPRFTANDLVSTKTLFEICIKLFTLQTEELEVHDCESIGLDGYYRCNKQNNGVCVLCNANIHKVSALLLPVYDFNKKKIKVLLVHDKYTCNEKHSERSLWYQVSKHAQEDSTLVINKTGLNSFNCQNLHELTDGIFATVISEWCEKKYSSSPVCYKAVPKISNKNWMNHSKIMNNANR